MSDQWPEPALDYVQAIADTKLLLGQRYAQWSLAAPSLEDDIGGASAAQEEVGHVRQLFRLLEQQGRDGDWLQGERASDEFANTASLDRVGEAWLEFLAAAGPADRAAWLLLDAIDHDDFRGMADKMGQDEYFHLEYHDARLATLAEEQPESLAAALGASLEAALATIGPEPYDEDTDPVYLAGFTTRPAADLRGAFVDHYQTLFADSPVSLDAVDWEFPSPEKWDETRRRVDGGGITEADLELLRGTRNREFLIR